MGYKALAIGAGLLLAGFATSGAWAKPAPTVYEMKYSGTVISGLDSQDVFGGGNLAGDSFTEVFDVSASKVKANPLGLSGSGAGSNDPVTSATLTITTKTGVKDTVVLTDAAVVLDGGAPKSASASGLVTLVDTRSQGLMLDSQTDKVCQRSSCDTYTLTGGLIDTVSGSAFPSNLNSDWSLKTGKNIVNDGSLFTITGDCGQLEGLVLGTTSAAPEPETWLLMVIGVGLLGAALRRAKSAGTVGALA